MVSFLLQKQPGNTDCCCNTSFYLHILPVVYLQKRYDGSLVMVRRKPQYENQQDLWAWTTPFTTELWVLVIVTTIASGVVYYLLDYMNTLGRGGNKKETELNLVESIYFACIGFTGHLIHLPKKAAPQILVLSMCFLFLLIMAAYTANLASFLVVRNTPGIIITDITDAIRNDLSFCVLQSSTSEATLVTEYNAARVIQRESIAETYRSVVDGECDIVLTTVGTWRTYERNAQHNRGCSLEWVGRVVKPFSAGFSLRDSAQNCSSIFRDILSLHMVEMKLDRGDIVIWDQIINERATISCLANGQTSGSDDGDDEDDYKLNLDNLGGVFIVHAMAMTVAMGLTIFTWLRRRQSRSRDDRKESGLPSSTHEVVTTTPKSPNNGTNEPATTSATSSSDHASHNQTSNQTKSQTNHPRVPKFRDRLRESIVLAPPSGGAGNASPTNEANHSSSPPEPEHLRKKEWIMMVVMTAAVAAMWALLFVLTYV